MNGHLGGPFGAHPASALGCAAGPQGPQRPSACPRHCGRAGTRCPDGSWSKAHTSPGRTCPGPFGGPSVCGPGSAQGKPDEALGAGWGDKDPFCGKIIYTHRPSRQETELTGRAPFKLPAPRPARRGGERAGQACGASGGGLVLALPRPAPLETRRDKGPPAPELGTHPFVSRAPWFWGDALPARECQVQAGAPVSRQ